MSERVADPAVQKEMEELHQPFDTLHSDVFIFLAKEPLDLKEFHVFVSSPPPPWKKQQRPHTCTKVGLECNEA